METFSSRSLFVSKLLSLAVFPTLSAALIQVLTQEQRTLAVTNTGMV